MRAVDTNVLVRLLARDDAKQVTRAESFVASGAWISHIVLVEAVWVLDSVFERTPAQIAAAVNMLLEHNMSIVEWREALVIVRNHTALNTVQQADVLGPAYLGLHVAAQANSAYLSSQYGTPPGTDAFHAYNPLESGPMMSPPQPWPW